MMSEALKHRVAVDCKQEGKTAAQFDAIYKKKVYICKATMFHIN